MSRAKSKAKPPAPAKKNYLPFIIIGGVLAVVVGVAVATLGPGRESKEAGGAGGPAAPASPPPRRTGSPGAQPARSRGKESATVVLEEFGDFQCPPCGALHPVLQKIESDYHSRMKFVFRHFPLQQIHKNAFAAARAAEAAGVQGRFWEMHDLLYDNQAEWSESPDPRPIFLSYARRIGVDDRRLQTDMDSQEVGRRVSADYDRGNSLGVTGTPTIFLNGRPLHSSRYSEAKLREDIEAALAGAAQ